MEINPHMTIESIIRSHPETEETLKSYFEGGDYLSTFYSSTLEELTEIAGLDLEEIMDELVRHIQDEE